MRSILTFLFLISITTALSQNKEAHDSLKKPETVSIRVIERVPVYKGCEDDLNKNNCLNNKIRRFIGRHFNVNDAKCLEYKTEYDKKLKKEVKVCTKEVKAGRVTIKTTFVIDTIGYTTDIKALSPYPLLNEEAVRVIKKLPKFKPGFQRGRKVRVRYRLPIMFNIL
ncbi:energy transducer TonB [Flavobacteriaceae bacterium S356]|uniref:Energy transducer TonB n=1 Tax=Asprobacillus argus TaxID=3076534 RepID=A0ABU3LB60_9FLAO|nr:energy transducer TonB [Flavobacteriaceae bacterium S356]